jgi:dihydroorotate dehydrogenase (NAD+) catalytic subunit
MLAPGLAYHKELSMNLSIQLAPKHHQGLLLANPVMTASGTFGYGTEYSHLFDIQRLGAIVCKGTTPEPRDGNPQPRVAETPCGLLNSIGLQNIGVKALIRDKAPIWASWRVPVIVNIAGETIDDYAKVADELDGVAGISAVEINISCPNIKAGGIEFGANPDSASRVVSAVKAVTSLPVLVKLTPNASDIAKVAVAVAEAGADAISPINTLKGMAIDVARRRPLLGDVTGGLSGPAIKPVALYMVYEVAGAVDLPVIGCGGITTSSDAIEFIMAGASAIQVGTANLTNPRAPLDILEGIEKFMEKEGIKDIADLIGAARR